MGGGTILYVLHCTVLCSAGGCQLLYSVVLVVVAWAGRDGESMVALYSWMGMGMGGWRASSPWDGMGRGGYHRTVSEWP